MLDEIVDYVKFLRLQVKVCVFQLPIGLHDLGKIRGPSSTYRIPPVVDWRPAPCTYFCKKRPYTGNPTFLHLTAWDKSIKPFKKSFLCGKAFFSKYWPSIYWNYTFVKSFWYIPTSFLINVYQSLDIPYFIVGSNHIENSRNHWWPLSSLYMK